MRTREKLVVVIVVVLVLTDYGLIYNHRENLKDSLTESTTETTGDVSINYGFGDDDIPWLIIWTSGDTVLLDLVQVEYGRIVLYYNLTVNARGLYMQLPDASDTYYIYESFSRNKTRIAEVKETGGVVSINSLYTSSNLFTFSFDLVERSATKLMIAIILNMSIFNLLVLAGYLFVYYRRGTGKLDRFISVILKIITGISMIPLLLASVLLILGYSNSRGGSPDSGLMSIISYPLFAPLTLLVIMVFASYLSEERFYLIPMTASVLILDNHFLVKFLFYDGSIIWPYSVTSTLALLAISAYYFYRTTKKIEVMNGAKPLHDPSSESLYPIKEDGEEFQEIVPTRFIKRARIAYGILFFILIFQ